MLKNKPLKLRVGGLLAGQTFELDEQFLSYRDAYGRGFTVPRSQVETAAVDVKGRGKGLLKVVGKGTVLASAELPMSWANDAQRWILSNLPQA